MYIKNLGCDPEVFLSNGVDFISSQGRIGGTKMFPMPIDNDGNALQEDNVTVEFNTPPCNNVNDFIKHIRKNMEVITELAAMQGLKPVIAPSAIFNQSELESPGAREFGCEPDFNAYTGEVNPRPNADNKQLRSCGGHIHVDLSGINVDRREVIKWMDVYVGVQLLKYDTDSRRRELYGLPGAYREKPYGVEYRTPSNVWIKNDELIRFVWDQTDKAIGRAVTGDKMTADQEAMVQKCIMTSNMELLKIIEKELGA